MRFDFDTQTTHLHTAGKRWTARARRSRISKHSFRHQTTAAGVAMFVPTRIGLRNGEKYQINRFTSTYLLTLCKQMKHFSQLE